MVEVIPTGTRVLTNPFEKVFITRRDEIMRVVEVYQYAVRNMEGMAKLAEKIRRPANHVQFVQHVEEFALEDARKDFPAIHSMAVVLIWAAMETTIRDFLVGLIAARPQIRRSTKMAQLKIRFGEYDVLSEDDKIRYLIDQFEKESGSNFKRGVGKFDTLLSAVNLGAIVDDECRNSLHQMSAVRNVIAHRVGIVDQRFVDACPNYRTKLGESLTVSYSQLNRYVGACGQYLVAVVTALEASGA